MDIQNEIELSNNRIDETETKNCEYKFLISKISQNGNLLLEPDFTIEKEYVYQINCSLTVLMYFENEKKEMSHCNIKIVCINGNFIGGNNGYKLDVIYGFDNNNDCIYEYIFPYIDKSKFVIKIDTWKEEYVEAFVSIDIVRFNKKQ